MKFYIACLIFILSLQLSAAEGVHSSFQFEKIPQKILDPTIKAHPKLFDEIPTPAKMDKILEVLYETGEFETLKISESNNKVIISGTPLKIIASISIQGLSKLNEAAVLTAFNIAQGEKFIFQNVYDGAERVKELYGKNGYFNTVVSINPEPASNNRIHLQIIIDEQTPCIVKRIDFITAYSDLNEHIKHEVKSYINKPLTDDLILNVETDVKEYFVENKILSVSIQGPIFQYNKEKTESYITYTLENAYKYILFYEGNQYFSNTELSNKLQIDNQVQFGSNPTAELASKLEKIYQSYGFAHVSVKYTENIEAKSFSRKAYFKINEGPRTYLKVIKFNGKLSRPQDYYVDLFRQLYKAKIYKQEDIKEAQEDLIEELQNQGFLKAQFLSGQTTFSPDKKAAELSLFIDEGPQTKVNSINFEGINALSKEQLKRVIEIKERSPMNLGTVEKSGQKLIDHYKNLGYLEMELKSSMSELVKYSDDNTKADLYYKIFEGPQIKVSKIVVEGNSLTKQYVIINELEFDEGDVLTPQKIADSEYHLQKTGLFTQVDISTLEKGTSDSDRTILIRVSERDPGLFTLGLGANTEFNLTLRGYAGLGYNNIAGTARALSGRVEVKKVADIDFIDHTITLGYLEPTLFAKRTRGRINLIRTREIISRANDKAKVLDSNRINFLIEKDFTRFLKFTWVAWSISTNKEFEFPIDNVDQKTITEKVNIASIGPIIEYDKRDDPFVTKKGYYTKLSSEYAHPDLGSTSTVHYIRNVGQLNTYVPIKFRGTVWASSMSAGYLKNIEDNGNTSVPDIKSFKLGGRDTLRGFAPNELPHNNKDKYGNEVLVKSESNYYLLKTEFRVPVYGQIESVLFYDGGAVSVQGNTFSDPYRDSVGIGFRYQTPVGPLAIEYGRKLDRDRALDESAGRFHLSFGTF
jgi:outer membrane protein insertion porin family